MSDPMNVKIDGHVENADSTQITKEQFNAIKSGDTVFLKNGENGVMRHRLTRSIYLSDKNRTQVYPEDLRPPFFLAKSEPKQETLQQETKPKEQIKAPLKAVKKAENPMMTKLKILLARYPDHKDFILKRGATGTTTTEEIEGEIIMMSV